MLDPNELCATCRKSEALWDGMCEPCWVDAKRAREFRAAYDKMNELMDEFFAFEAIARGPQS